MAGGLGQPTRLAEAQGELEAHGVRVTAGVENALNDQASIPSTIENCIAVDPQHPQVLAQIDTSQSDIGKVSEPADGGLQAVELTLGSSNTVPRYVSPDFQEIVPRRACKTNDHSAARRAANAERPTLLISAKISPIG